jgi:hypothetical protein
MKTLIIAISIIFISFSLFSQDKIVRTNGETISCKITKEDSTMVYFTFNKNGKNINTHLAKNEILTIVKKTIPATRNYPPDRTSFGLGLGLNYGFIGGSYMFCPQKNIGLFLSGGYVLVGFGYNAGIKLRLEKKMNTTILIPTLTAMYGYNAVIKGKDNSDFDKIFYGPSIGIGLDAHFKRKNAGYWSFDLFFPIRGSEVEDYMTDLENNHGATFDNELFPITISIGHRFIINAN